MLNADDVGVAVAIFGGPGGTVLMRSIPRGLVDGYGLRDYLVLRQKAMADSSP